MKLEESAMPLEDAFWQDILENPGDDAPRLIYADWLEEQGDPDSRALAEFIRVQMELEQPRKEGPRLWALKQREADLLRAHRVAWVGSLREQVWGEEFRRGFVETVTLAPEHFLERAETVLALAPVRRLRLTGTAGQSDLAIDHQALLGKIAASPHLRQLIGLRLEMPLSASAARALADSPHLSELTELEIHSPELTEASLRALLDSPAFRLRRLLLQGGRVFDRAVVHVVAAAPALAGLVELGLHTGGLGATELRALTTSEHLLGLSKLDLSHNRIDPDGIAALADGPLVHRLEELFLAGNGFGDDGLIAWLSRAVAPRLHRLDLGFNQIHAPGAEALARWPSLVGLTSLNLRSNIIASGLSALANSGHVERLIVLLLHFNGIRDDAVEALAGSEHLPELVWLDLMANRITSVGAGALARSPHLGKLARLQLDRNDISPVEEQELVKRFGACVTI
jgi:uncharacterized protein (TIGR02996 family)